MKFNILGFMAGLFLLCTTVQAEFDKRDGGLIIFQNSTKYPIEIKHNGGFWEELAPHAKTDSYSLKYTTNVHAKFTRQGLAKFLSENDISLHRVLKLPNRVLDLDKVKKEGYNKQVLVNLMPGTLMGIKIGSINYSSLAD